jgi:thioredoxin 1
MDVAVAINGSSFDEDVLQSDVPVLVDFTAPWCPPCRAIAPAVDAVAHEFAGKAKVYKLNIEDGPDIVVRYGVQAIPTLIVFKGGQRVGELVGQTSRDVIANALQRAL